MSTRVYPCFRSEPGVCTLHLNQSSRGREQEHALVMARAASLSATPRPAPVCLHTSISTAQRSAAEAPRQHRSPVNAFMHHGQANAEAERLAICWQPSRPTFRPTVSRQSTSSKIDHHCRVFESTFSRDFFI